MILITLLFYYHKMRASWRWRRSNEKIKRLTFRQ
jgi:hypothetical protein